MFVNNEVRRRVFLSLLLEKCCFFTGWYPHLSPFISWQNQKKSKECAVFLINITIFVVLNDSV